MVHNSEDALIYEVHLTSYRIPWSLGAQGPLAAVCMPIRNTGFKPNAVSTLTSLFKKEKRTAMQFRLQHRGIPLACSKHARAVRLSLKFARQLDSHSQVGGRRCSLHFLSFLWYIEGGYWTPLLTSTRRHLPKNQPLSLGLNGGILLAVWTPVLQNKIPSQAAVSVGFPLPLLTPCQNRAALIELEKKPTPGSTFNFVSMRKERGGDFLF